jgi:hypothetical protein
VAKLGKLNIYRGITDEYGSQSVATHGIPTTHYFDSQPTAPSKNKLKYKNVDIIISTPKHPRWASREAGSHLFAGQRCAFCDF